MSLGTLGFGLKLMAVSAENMLFDLYQIKNGDTKYNYYCKSSDYETFLKVMLEKSGNPDRYRQIRNIAHSQKDSFTDRNELFTHAESRFDQYIEKNKNIFTTTDFKIYSAVALIECQKQAIKLINIPNRDLNNNESAKLATMTGYIYACFFMLSIDKVEEKVKSKSQSDRAVAGGEKRKAEILTEAISVLKGESSKVYFWNTKNKKPGSLRIGLLSETIASKDSIDIKPQQIKTHLKELIKSNRLYPEKYYKKGQ